MFVLLKMPVVCIMALCLISGAASVTFMESMLSLYLDKQASKAIRFSKIFLRDTSTLRKMVNIGERYIGTLQIEFTL